MGSSIYHHHCPYHCPNLFPHVIPSLFPNLCLNPLRTESYSLFSDKSRFGYFFRVVPSDYFQAKVHPNFCFFNFCLHQTIKQFNNQQFIHKRTRELLIIVLLIFQQFYLSRFPHIFYIFQVLVDLILRAGWNYVSVVNTEGKFLEIYEFQKL